MDDIFTANYKMLSAHTHHSMDLPMSSIHKTDINYQNVHKSDVNYPIVQKPDVHFPSIHKTDINFPSVHKPDVNFSSVHDTAGRCSPLNGVETKVSFGFTQEQVECVCEVSVKFSAIPLWIYVILNIDNFINTFNQWALLKFQNSWL